MILGVIVATTLGAGATRWSIRIPNTQVLACALILNLSLLLIISGPIGTIAAMLGGEFFSDTALTKLAIWGQQIFPDTTRATATSLLGAITGFTIALINAGIGALWDGMGLQPVVGTAALAIAVAMIVIIGPLRFMGIPCACDRNYHAGGSSRHAE